MTDYEDREFWLWAPTGDYTCSDCMGTPFVHLDEPDQHDRCDCEVMSHTMPGRLAPENLDLNTTSEMTETKRHDPSVSNRTEDDMEVSETVDVSYGEGIIIQHQEAAEALGKSGSYAVTTESVDITVTVPPGKRVVFESSVTTEDWEITADLCYYYYIEEIGEEEGPLCSGSAVVADQIVKTGDIEVTAFLEDI